jgi:hypothetical protein
MRLHALEGLEYLVSLLTPFITLVIGRNCMGKKS